MEAVQPIFWFGILVLSGTVLVGFFCVWHHISVIHSNSRYISYQLDLLLKASGLDDPQEAMRKMLAERGLELASK